MLSTIPCGGHDIYQKCLNLVLLKCNYNGSTIVKYTAISNLIAVAKDGDS